MPRNSLRTIIVLSSVFFSACASHPPLQRVWVPPRLDLKPYEIIGMVGFSSTTKGSLAALATRRFEDAVRRDQGMVRMIEVGPQREALAPVGQARWNPESCRAVGRKNGARTLFTGTLTLSRVRPTIQLSALLNSGQVTAEVEATLEVQMIESETGASIWSSAGKATRTLGQVSVLGGKNYSFDADDPERAYGDLVDSLVVQVTRDFQGSWRTQ
jgi:hypothetical protein